MTEQLHSLQAALLRTILLHLSLCMGAHASIGWFPRTGLKGSKRYTHLEYYLIVQLPCKENTTYILSVYVSVISQHTYHHLLSGLLIFSSLKDGVISYCGFNLHISCYDPALSCPGRTLAQGCQASPLGPYLLLSIVICIAFLFLFPFYSLEQKGDKTLKKRRRRSPQEETLQIELLNHTPQKIPFSLTHLILFF